MGRALGNNLLNLGAYGEVKEALEELGIDINALEDQEPDPALGNGGLGRLAACFLDSLATLGYPAYGCGIRYRYGMFKQEIRDGYQVEVPDAWLENGYPFELRRPEYAKEVHFGGYVRVEYDQATGQNKFIHEGYQAVKAIPYDMPIVGYENNVVNTLRIWDAAAIEQFGFDSFDKGDYKKAVEQENLAKDIVNVLYPNDNKMSGKELRLKQQYFFVSASIQAAIEKYKKTHDDIKKLHEKVVFQMNDTHPTMAVAELMRILMDQEGLGWDDAWAVTTKCVAYTNHTILAEALEKWPAAYLEQVAPQLLPFIRALDQRARQRCDDPSTAIWDADNVIHMAHMDIHSSAKVNGVAELHTEILKGIELHPFYVLYPEKFNNKTNGITFRRWLMGCNPALASLITQAIGPEWKRDAAQLEGLLVHKDDNAFLEKLLAVKEKNKSTLAHWLEERGTSIDPHSVLDVQIKRLHQYKRQQMNALYAIWKYLQIKDGHTPPRPVTMVFGAKAAPAYTLAKDTIHLLLCLSKLIEQDAQVSPWLKLVMVENYNVSVAERLVPACDISEQISLASKEASGTGNMKLMANGAVTLGTLDGANVEIARLVGEENIYLFGRSADEVISLYQNGAYRSSDYWQKPELDRLVDFILSPELLALGDAGSLSRLYKDFIAKDYFMALLDLEEYIAVKERCLADYEDRAAWSRRMLVNIARSGFFSSDRTIAEYNRDIWHLK